MKRWYMMFSPKNDWCVFVSAAEKVNDNGIDNKLLRTVCS